MDFLTRIRSKSPAVRAQYALFSALIITGGIAVVWATTIPTRFSNIHISQEASSTDGVAKNAVPETAGVEEPVANQDSGALGALQVSDELEESTSTPSTTSGTVEPDATATHSATSTGSRVIQIGTTSQNAR